MAPDVSPQSGHSTDPEPSHPAGRNGSADAWSAFSLIPAGVLVWGVVGWLLDTWLETRGLVVVGLLVGAVGGSYLVWLRYGRS
ncbi:hypothetical protein BH24ACT13_BH24ACT13_00030 [soil metagenome]